MPEHNTFPLRSHIGYAISRLLPRCVTGWFYIAAMDDLHLNHMQWMTVVHEGYECENTACPRGPGIHPYLHADCHTDGYSMFDAVSAVRVENVRRAYYRNFLRAGTRESDGPERHPGFT